MDDQQVLDSIDKLVKEEEDLLHRHEGEGLDDDEHARLEEIKIQLDKTWDYLRQRRSLSEAGDDPDQASERDGGTVEEYGPVTPYGDTDAAAPESAGPRGATRRPALRCSSRSRPRRAPAGRRRR